MSHFSLCILTYEGKKKMHAVYTLSLRNTIRSIYLTITSISVLCSHMLFLKPYWTLSFHIYLVNLPTTCLRSNKLLNFWIIFKIYLTDVFYTQKSLIGKGLTPLCHSLHRFHILFICWLDCTFNRKWKIQIHVFRYPSHL